MRSGMPDAVVTSKYIAANNPETCINCGICLERYQFKARYMKNNKMVYDRTRCFGCGVCVSTCPNQSISLVKRTANSNARKRLNSLAQERFEPKRRNQIWSEMANATY